MRGKVEGILYKQKNLFINVEESEPGMLSGLKKVPVPTNNAESRIHEVRKESMDNRYGKTKWGLINSITEVAQNYTLDKREELEIAEGNILTSA